MILEIARLFLEYLKVFLSPHIAIVGAVLFFLLKYKAAVEVALTSRRISVKGPGGWEATIDQQRQATEHGTEAVHEAQQLAQTALQVRVADDVATDEIRRSLQQAQQLAQHYARWWAFEKIYRVIFRSQIYLLRHLQTRPDCRARWTELRSFYEQGGVPTLAYPYENYMHFLRNNGLIEWTTAPYPGGAEADVTLTDMGVDFLGYLATNNYNILEKPF